jgi:antirestriction protein
MINTIETTSKVWVADLAAYNNGNLEGFWMELTSDADGMAEEIQDFMDAQTEKHGELREEYAFHDYDNPINPNWGEYESLETIAEVMEVLESVDAEVLQAGISLGIQLSEIADKFMGSYDDEEDFGYQDLENSGRLSELEQMGMLHYIDMKHYAKECLMDYSWDEIGGTIYVFNN